MKAVKEYFQQYPASTKCFTTSDGLVFHQDGDANLHAKGLKDNHVKEHHVGDNADKANEGGDVKVLPYNKWKKDELKAELTEREIAFEDTATNADLVALLDADDAKGKGE